LALLIVIIVVSGFYTDEETIIKIGSHAKKIGSHLHKKAKELANGAIVSKNSSPADTAMKYEWLAGRICTYTGLLCPEITAAKAKNLNKKQFRRPKARPVPLHKQPL
jgi:hypothetical protein